MLEAGKSSEQVGDELFCGTIKSFNSRRGFGFLACEATAQRFGRDVYLSRDEAMLLADEPAVGHAGVQGVAVVNGAASTAKEQSKAPPPVQEGDFLMFQVKLSLEGFPQAVQARKMRRLRGLVSQIPSPAADGVITISGDGSDCANSSDVPLKELLGVEVRLRHEACGQLQLESDDEIAFCCVNMEENDGCLLEAQLVELLHTSRASGSALGCFSLTLPLPDGEVDAGVGPKAVELHGHALTDRVLLIDVPLELNVSDLTRVFSKLGGIDATLTRDNGSDASCSAIITFDTVQNVAKFLVQASHTVSENGTTQLAYMGPWAPAESLSSLASCATSAETDASITSPRWEDAYPHQMQPVVQSVCSPCVVAPEMPTVNAPSCGGFALAQHADWRCSHGSIIVPAAAPEVEVVAGNGFSVCVLWPTVVHASAYIVELLDQASMASQHYTRVTPDGPLPFLMDLRIDGLRPSSYVSRLYCIAPCGCQSPPSPWSVLSVACALPLAGMPFANASQIVTPHAAVASSAITIIPDVFSQSCPPPPSAPPAISVAAAPTTVLPPVPEVAADDVATLPVTSNMVSLPGVLLPQAGLPPCAPPANTAPTFVSHIAPAPSPQTFDMTADQNGPMSPPLHMQVSNADRVNYDVPLSCPPPPSAPPSFHNVTAALPLTLPPILEEMPDSRGEFYGDTLTLD